MSALGEIGGKDFSRRGRLFWSCTTTEGCRGEHRSLTGGGATSTLGRLRPCAAAGVDETACGSYEVEPGFRTTNLSNGRPAGHTSQKTQPGASQRGLSSDSVASARSARLRKPDRETNVLRPLSERWNSCDQTAVLRKGSYRKHRGLHESCQMVS